MKNNEEMKNESVGRLLVKFSIPAIVGMMVMALYNVVDRIYIGWLGPLVMTGIGLNLPFMTLLMAFGMLIGIGGAAIVSIRLGQDRGEEAEKILGNAVSLLFVLMAAISVLGLIFSPHFSPDPS